MSRPRVLVFAPVPPPVNGQSRVTATAVDALSRHARVETVSTAEAGRVWRPPGRLPVGRAASWLRALAAFRWALRTRPDVVYLTPASSALGLARDVLSVSLIPDGVPVVAHVHVGDWGRLLDDSRLGPLARKTAARFTRVLVPSHYAARGLAGRLPGVPVRVVPNTVPAEVRVTAAEVEAKWSRARRDVPHVAFVSHMIPSKGYMKLAEGALAYEQRTGTPLRVTFAGAWPDAHDQAAFEAWRLRHGVASRWTAAGPLSGACVRALLLDADVFAFPSEYPHESFGLAALEAMNAGCGVVAVHHAAIAELVRDGVDGRLVDPGGDFAEALADVLDDRERYGLAAASRARDAFAADDVEAQLVHAITGLDTRAASAAGGDGVDGATARPPVAGRPGALS